MAGHSKWANIKHRKQFVDDKRSKEFQKIAHEISKTAATNPDPKTNSMLRAIIARARSVNMPQVAIARALNKNKINDKNTQLSYFFGGIFHKTNLLIHVVSDNKLRALTILKKVLQKSPIEIVPASAIFHFFNRFFLFKLKITSENELLNLINDLEVTDINFVENIAKIKLSSAELAKELHKRCLQNEIEIQAQTEEFISLNSFSTSQEIKDDYFCWKNKILEETEAVAVYSNIEFN